MCFGPKRRRDSLDVIFSGETPSILHGGSVVPLQRPAPIRHAHSSRISSTTTAAPRPQNDESRRTSSQKVDSYQRFPRELLLPTLEEVIKLPRAGGPSTPNGQSKRVSSSDVSTNPTMNNRNSSAIRPRSSVGPSPALAGTLGTKTGPSRRASSPNMNPNPPATPQQLPAVGPRNPNNPFRKPVLGLDDKANKSRVSTSIPNQTRNVSSPNTNTNPPERPRQLPAASPENPNSPFRKPGPGRINNPYRSTASDSIPTQTQNASSLNTATNPPARQQRLSTASNSAATAPSRTKALTRHNSPPPARSHKPTASKSSSVAESVTSGTSSVSSASLDSLDKRLIKKLALKRARKQLLRSLSGRRDSNSSSSSSDVDPDIVLFALHRDAKNKAKQAKRNAEKLEDRRRGQQRTGFLGGQDGTKGKPQSKAENTELSRPKSLSNTDSGTQMPPASESGTMKGSFGDFLKWKKQEAAKESLRGVLGMESMPALRPATFVEFCKEKEASGGDKDEGERPKSSSPPASTRAGRTTITASSKEPAPVSAKKGPKLLVPPLKPATTMEEKEASLSKDTSKGEAMRPPTTLREALEARRKVRERERAREREEAEERAQADEDTSQPEPGGLLGALRRARLEREEAEKAGRLRNSRMAGAGGIAGEARKSSTPTLTEKKGPKLTVPVLAGHATSSPKPATSTPTPTPKTKSTPGPRSSRAVAKWPKSTYKDVHVRGPDAPGAVSLAEVTQQRRAVARWRRNGTDIMAWQGVLAQWWSKHGTWTARETQIIDAIRRTVEVM